MLCRECWVRFACVADTHCTSKACGSQIRLLAFMRFVLCSWVCGLEDDLSSTLGAGRYSEIGLLCSFRLQRFCHKPWISPLVCLPWSSIRGSMRCGSGGSEGRRTRGLSTFRHMWLHSLSRTLAIVWMLVRSLHKSPTGSNDCLRGHGPDFISMVQANRFVSLHSLGWLNPAISRGGEWPTRSGGRAIGRLRVMHTTSLTNQEGQ